MSSTTMMTRMQIEEEAILLRLTKRMKLNSNYEEMRETVSRVNMNSKENLAYVFPSLTQENIDGFFHNGFNIKGQNDNTTQAKVRRKRNYAQISTEPEPESPEPDSIPSQDIIIESKVENDNSNANIQIIEPENKIDRMIDEMIKFQSKEELKCYLKHKLNEDACIRNSNDNHTQFKYKTQMIQEQIKSGIENANELNKTLIVTRTAKEKESHRTLIKYEISKQAKDLLEKISSIKKQIEIEKNHTEDYKRMILAQQEL